MDAHVSQRTRVGRLMAPQFSVRAEPFDGAQNRMRAAKSKRTLSPLALRAHVQGEREYFWVPQ